MLDMPPINGDIELFVDGALLDMKDMPFMPLE